MRPPERPLVECLDLFDFRLRERGELLLPRLPRELPIALFQEANQKIDDSSGQLHDVLHFTREAVEGFEEPDFPWKVHTPTSFPSPTSYF